jgi:DNA/RNA-binding domain of Phe-tRNA-synthetase-like protein
MSYRLVVDSQIFEQFPDYQALIIYAEGLNNFASTEESRALLRTAEQTCRASLTLNNLAQHPHIAAWREAYRRFGAKPKKYPCSVEALLQRTLKGQNIPAINGIVDLYNALSLKYVLPVGGEDRDKLVSDLRLTYAQGQEPFVTTQDGQEQIVYPDAGEIIWADTDGVTCRRWNWRQGRRTQLTEETRSIYFVLDRLAPYPVETLWAAGEELKQHLLQWFPHSSITTDLLQV